MSKDKRLWHGWYNLARWCHPSNGRRAVQLAQQPLCIMCIQQEIVTEADTADHVTPHRGDPDLFWFGELQSLCASCHSRHKQREERGTARPAIGVDGYPIE